jgi:hypothetical protein
MRKLTKANKMMKLRMVMFEREMCPWAISKYFGDCVPTQVLKCKSMPTDEQSANQQ